MLYDLWERYKRLLIGFAVLCFLALSFWLYNTDTMKSATLPLETPAYATEPTDNATTPSQTMSTELVKQGKPQAPAVMYADIKGSVKHPGMYSFQTNERIAHLIEKAGGLLPQADSQQINLAQPLSDGISMLIPAKGERHTSSPCLPASSQASATTTTAQTGAQTNQPSSGSGMVNLNTATLQQLMTLPGVGETRAQAILAYRQKKGLFQQIEDLKKVAGIGDKTFERLKSKISVR